MICESTVDTVSESAMSLVASRANREGEVKEGYVSAASGLPDNMVAGFPETEQYGYNMLKLLTNTKTVPVVVVVEESGCWLHLASQL